MLLFMPLLSLFLSVVNAELYDEYWKLTEHTKGKECHEYFMGSLAKAYFPDAESTLEYWEKYLTLCDESEGSRIDRLQTFARIMGQHAEDHNCEVDTEHPVCQCFSGLIEKAEGAFNHYIDIDVCEDPEKEAKKLENME